MTSLVWPSTSIDDAFVDVSRPFDCVAFPDAARHLFKQTTPITGMGDRLMAQEWDVSFTVGEQLRMIRIGAASYPDIRKYLEQFGPHALVSILRKQEAELLGLAEGEIIRDPPKFH